MGVVILKFGPAVEGRSLVTSSSFFQMNPKVENSIFHFLVWYLFFNI